MKRPGGLEIVLGKNLELSGVDEELGNLLTKRLQFANPKWLENERLGRWNGGVPKVLRFYDRITQDRLRIPRGYLRQLILLCRQRQVPYQIQDQRRVLPQQDFRFIGQLKAFQKNAAAVMLAKDFGTLCAPTGSGKTVIALAMIVRRRQPALVVVHTKDLAYQWIARAQQFLGIPADNIGLIGAGKKKVGPQITVALVQSLYKCADLVAPAVGHLIVDECHRTPSRTFTEAVNEFDAQFMLGLSATPYRRDSLSQLIFWHLGDLHHQVDKSELVLSRQILQAQVILRPTAFVPHHDPIHEYSQMLSELTVDDERNRLICSDISKEAVHARGVCLVLSDRKKHCETLKAILKYKFGVDSDLLTGDLTLEERKSVLKKLNEGQIKVLIATGQLVGEGFDCENLATLFLVTPIRFSGRVIQYIGRILRPSREKDQARIFDYVDEQVEVLKTAARARQRIYND